MAATNCEVLALSRRQMFRVLSEFPDARHAIISMAEQRHTRLQSFKKKFFLFFLFLWLRNKLPLIWYMAMVVPPRQHIEKKTYVMLPVYVSRLEKQQLLRWGFFFPLRKTIFFSPSVKSFFFFDFYYFSKEKMRDCGLGDSHLRRSHSVFTRGRRLSEGFFHTFA